MKLNEAVFIGAGFTQALRTLCISKAAFYFDDGLCLCIAPNGAKRVDNNR